MSNVITAKKIKAAPGADLYRMTKRHLDADGYVWPSGTEYQPLSGGYDNVLNAAHQTVSINGKHIRFYENDKVLT